MIAAPIEGDDASLVALSLRGEQRAFTVLMRRHKEKLYRFVRAYVGDADEAYDLTQESFVAAWAGLSRFDSKRSFHIWLRRIALNKCRDWGRRRVVRNFFFAAQSLDTPGADIAAPQEPTNEPQELRLAALDAAIASLPASLKEPLVLTLLEGLSHKDAAILLGVTPKAVETRVYRAKALLARSLAP
jgi:RNA polymerase sigma-70 factor (ECF subfamily)